MASVRQAGKWLRLLTGRSKLGIRGALRTLLHAWQLRRQAGRAPIDQTDTGTLATLPGHPTRLDVPGDLARILKYGRLLTFFLARSDPGYDLLTFYGGGQVEKMCQADQLRIIFIEDADHTFSRRGPRDTLLLGIVTHLCGRYQKSTPQPAFPADAIQEENNSKHYERADLVDAYRVPNLLPAEAVTFVRYRDQIVARRVLELGCGAGRLATYLRPLTKQYVGLDVSPHMVAYSREHLPDMTFVQGDMRDLTRFADASFDTVFAVFNLFDAVQHTDRLRILSEAARVLAPEGLLVFSTHNRNYAAHQGRANPPAQSQPGHIFA